MVISFDKAFLFVHVPKTGGTSLRAVLSAYEHGADRLWTNRLLEAVGISVNYCVGSHQHYRFRTHDPISQVAKVYRPELMAQLFKFGFVRNPWDLLVSYRNFIVSSPKNKRHRRVVRMTFDEFIDFAILKGIGRQKPLLADDRGRLLVDFVGRFEDLQQDYLLIAQRLQVPNRLPHMNRGPAHDYREQYTPRSQQRVQDAFAEDIETFGYSFDGACSVPSFRHAA